MAKIDKTYHSILKAIKESGYKYRTDNRPDEDMIQISSINVEHSLMEFPVMTTKELYFKGVVTELLWFLRGDDNIKFLVDNGVHIWDKDAYNYFPKEGLDDASYEKFIENVKKGVISGDVGRNYGVQWRDWTKVGPDNDGEPVLQGGFDQISQLIDNLRKPNPINRRHIVTAWNPAEVNDTALPPCHWSFEVLPRPLSTQQKIINSGGDQEYLDALWHQAYMKNDMEAKGLLEKEIAHVPDYGFTLKWHQRSVDTFLGLPFNIASYALLSHIIGSLTGLMALSIIADLSNVHIYGSHTDAVDKQLRNNPGAFAAPRLATSKEFDSGVELFRSGEINFSEFIAELKPEDFWLEDYQNFGKISAKMVAPIK